MASLDMGMVSCVTWKSSLRLLTIGSFRTFKMAMSSWVFHSHTWTLHRNHPHRQRRPSSQPKWIAIQVTIQKIYHVSPEDSLMFKSSFMVSFLHRKENRRENSLRKMGEIWEALEEV
jgi:hypothetical protein